MKPSDGQPPAGLPDSADALRALVERWCNGEADDADTRSLASALKESPEARRYYRRYLNLHSALHEHADSAAPPESKPAKGRVLRIAGGLAAAAAAIIGAINWLPRTPPAPDPPISVTAEPVPPGVAVVARDVGVVWQEGLVPLETGENIPSRDVSILDGLLQIDFFSGATVVMEGPATMRLESGERGTLISGQIRVRVPPQASGFTVTTDLNTYVDLGTEFGIRKDQDGSEQLHVFEGVVEVSKAGAVPSGAVRVDAGDGLATDGGGQRREAASNAFAFVSVEDLVELERLQDSDRYRTWKKGRSSIVGRDDLLCYFDFEQTDPPTQILNDRGRFGYHGAIVGCSWAEGRWPNKGALEFKRAGDRVRIDIPGEFSSLSLVASVRIDGFDRDFNSLMLSDRFDHGHLHWQVKSNGVLDLGVKPPGAERLIYLSPRVLNGDDIGRWLHLAAVYDGERQQVSHYLNGELVAAIPFKSGSDRPPRGLAPFRLRIGEAELGNWSPAKRYDAWPVRNLNGRIDEFAIFDGALAKGTIRELYTAWRPGVR